MVCNDGLHLRPLNTSFPFDEARWRKGAKLLQRPSAARVECLKDGSGPVQQAMLRGRLAAMTGSNQSKTGGLTRNAFMFINRIMFSFTFQGFINHHSTALLRIVAGLMAWAGIVDGKPVERMAWGTYRAILRILRPAESAARRLIAIAAEDLPIKLRTKSPASKAAKNRMPSPASANQAKGQADGKERRYMFSLFDPRRQEEAQPKKRGPIPRIWTIEAFVAQKRHQVPRDGPSADGTVGTERVCRRLFAVRQALNNIPDYAKRYAALRNIPVEDRPPHRINMLRPGPAPWLPKKLTHEVHKILSECHILARCPVPKDRSGETSPDSLPDSLSRADTS